MAAPMAAQTDAEPMPTLPMTLPRTLEACRSMPLDPKTIFICSYPKSGTTWLQNVVYELCTRGQRPLDHISSYCPFFENDKSWAYAQDGTPFVAPPFAAGHSAIGYRIFNTHLRWEMMPKEGDARYVYVVRAPHDVCASFYHHLSHQSPEDGGYTDTLDAFVDDWCGGRIAFGSWRQHLLSWLKPEAASLEQAARDPRVLLLPYEGMKADLSGCVRRLASHLRLAVDEQALTDILPRLSFTYMKQNIHKFEPRSVAWIDKGDGFQFIRSGKVGSSNQLFTAKQDVRLQEYIQAGPLPASFSRDQLRWFSSSC